MDTTDERWHEAQAAEAEYPHFEQEGAAELDRLYSHLNLGPEFFEGARVLEVGAGNGPVYELNRANERVGIDPLSNHSETLPQVTRRDGNLVVTGVGERLPFEDGAFDVVICNNVLDHVQSVNRTLAEMCRVLDSEGRFILRVNAFETLNLLPEFARRVLDVVDRPHPHHFTPEEVVELLAPHDFEIDSVHVDHRERFSGHNLKFKIATGFFGFTKVGILASKA